MQQPLTKKQVDPSLTSGASGLSFKEMAWAKRAWFTRLSGDDNLLKWAAPHVIVSLVILCAIGLSKANLFKVTIGAIHPLRKEALAPLELPTTAENDTNSRPLTLPTHLNNFIDDVFNRAAVLPTNTQSEGEVAAIETKPEISTYTVESGDTIFGIAAKFGLAPETIMWSNPELEGNPDILSVGQQLTILPINGIYHQVGPGDTIEGIASTFNVDNQTIIDYPLNELDPDNLIIQPGQWLVVPGGTKPFLPRAVTAYTGPIPEGATAGSGIFVWPASGTIFQGYWSAHPGIDIAAWSGMPILAADSGYVVAAGWDNTGYGYHVVIDHGNGFQTLYAHLQAYYVDAGDNVAQGQQIGEMGNTGNSTGPHLHFEIRQGTVQRNPVGFLP